jgi:hypothetical protein
MANRLEEQVKAISEMAPAQLMAWIGERLERRDSLLEDNDPEESSSYPIVAIARHVSPVVIQALHRATVNLLATWMKDPDLTNGNDLLLLIQGLGVQGARADLEDMARSEHFGGLSVELQRRVLQTLIALGANLEPSFWYGVYRGAPTELAGITFDGLALISPNHAVDFLSAASGDESAAKQIAASLPGFMDDLVPARDRASIRALVESRLQEMQPRIAHAVTEFFTEEQTPLAVLPLAEPIAVKKPTRQWSISSENFPALSAFGATWERIFGLGPENPAKLFANLAHQ